MGAISMEIGKKIKSFRKSKGMTVQGLANLVHKSKATISKYENGDIVIEVDTLYALAKALGVHVEQLLYIAPNDNKEVSSTIPSAFFQGASRFYSYFYDGRNKQIVKCIMDIISTADMSRCKAVLYMNIKGYDCYENCENTYYGYIEHHDVLTSIVLKNQATSVEQIMINILASFLDSEKKWGLMAGVSFRPFMPIALKMLFSKKPLPENQDLINELKINKEDIRIMKMYNMMSIT
ncbi:helix-turn-helix domain-containing protein [Clostridium drakei]|uniref:Transcriptional regulator n=1 Tax=Clostridium drakei TaxID=332101 RepID=A0A2U8DP12_9CLOT|nr:helix-turn-helix transcriptional regulator [Clostridium drakei]AWI04399.1 transcriptional regulator [Clostridium drakei]